MMLQLTDRSSEPLHSQISRQVRARILAGELGDGGSLPSIRAMARQHKVSVITVQRAYEDLEKEGLIYTRRGKGFFVSGLTDEQKTELAQKRFEEAFEPLVDAALDEGLRLNRIQAAVNNILEGKRDES
jgi:GntR family transcriptional regulator